MFFFCYIEYAQRDSEPDAPILMPRSLFWSRFVRKTYLNKKDAQRDYEPNAPILMPRSLFWSRFVRKTYLRQKLTNRMSIDGVLTANSQLCNSFYTT